MKKPNAPIWAQRSLRESTWFRGMSEALHCSQMVGSLRNYRTNPKAAVIPAPTHTSDTARCRSAIGGKIDPVSAVGGAGEQNAAAHLPVHLAFGQVDL